MPNEPSESGTPPSGFPEPPGQDPDDRTRDQDPHHVLNNPATDPDPTEWPDPYDKRPDPRDPTDPHAHTPTGAISTSEPHPDQDLEADYVEGPKRDKVDD
jgi:hypothetical protein